MSFNKFIDNTNDAEKGLYVPHKDSMGTEDSSAESLDSNRESLTTRYSVNIPLTGNEVSLNKANAEEKSNVLGFEILKNEESLLEDKLYGNKYTVKKPKKMGNCFTFLFFKNRPVIVIGPDCILSTCLFTSVNITFALLNFFIFPYLGDVIRYIGVATFFLQVFSHAFTALINPGIPSRDFYVSNNRDLLDKAGYKVCKICNIVVHVNQNVSHCEDCNICVEGKIK